MLPPKDRLVGAQLHRYIRDNLYWVLHAPRQTGKTTFLQSWAKEINSGTEAVACYVSIESCQGIGRTEAMVNIQRAVYAFSKKAGLPIPELPSGDAEFLLHRIMQKWAELVAPKPLVVLFDEVDVMDTLLKEFQKFWRKHSEIWEQKADYTEAFPHLLVMAFLQRVLNGGGRINREYAAGRGRMDLSVEYSNITYIIEIKLIYSHDSPAEVLGEGLEQIVKYRDKIDKAASAYLVIFDRRPKTKEKPWEQRLSWEMKNGITVLGC